MKSEHSQQEIDEEDFKEELDAFTQGCLIWKRLDIEIWLWALSKYSSVYLDLPLVSFVANEHKESGSSFESVDEDHFEPVVEWLWDAFG